MEMFESRTRKHGAIISVHRLEDDRLAHDIIGLLIRGVRSKAMVICINTLAIRRIFEHRGLVEIPSNHLFLSEFALI